MPIRSHNAFDNLPERLNPGVNPYVAELVAATETGDLPIIYGPFLSGMAGNWRNRLGMPLSSKLVLEIGCHYGQVLNAMAKDHPDFGFVGLDITFKRVVKTGRAATRQQNANLLSVLANARALADLFAPGELSLIVVFFPDPWSKKSSTQRHRLMDKEFCSHALNCLEAGGQIWVKTDCKSYFDDISDQFRSDRVTQVKTVSGLNHTSYVSRFQKVFMDEGTSTYEGIWKKPL